jgi:cob(I)alamin adenosyltransferase
MVHLYYGDGKGKTTAAIGMCIRAAGHGLPVLFVQFLKNDKSGEVSILQNIHNIKTLHNPCDFGFVFQMTERQREKTACEFDRMLENAIDSNAFLIVLDEVLHALNAGLIEKPKLEKVLEKKGDIVLTGNEAPQWIIDKSDYISRIEKIKHPYDLGEKARIGIEY